MAGRIVIADSSQKALCQLVPILANEGFEVMGTTMKPEALSKLEKGECDLVILGASQNSEETGWQQPAAALVKFNRKKDTIGVLGNVGVKVLNVSNIPDAVGYILNEARVLREAQESDRTNSLAKLIKPLALSEGFTLLENLAQEIAADYAAVMEWDSEGRELTLRWSFGKAVNILNSHRGLRGMARSAAAKAQPLVLLEGKSSDVYFQREIDALRVSSAFFLPLLAKGKVVGVATYIKLQGHFTQSNVDKVSILSAVLALALENMRFEKELETRTMAAGEYAPRLKQRQQETTALNVLLRGQQLKVNELNQTCLLLQEKYATVLKSLVAIMETGRPSALGHSALAAQWIAALAEAMEVETDGLAEAAYLHDVGLAKDGEKEIEKHPIVAEKLAENLGLPPQACLAIRYHHENYAGGGYPDGLAGEQIPIGARLLAVVDAYTKALPQAGHPDTHRPDEEHSDEATSEAALANLRAEAGKAYDPAVVEAFVRIVGKEKPRPETEILSIASHELRSPLTSLVGYAELLTLQKDLDPATQERAGEIHAEALRMQRMVQELLNLSRLELGRLNLSLEKVNIDELIEQAVSSARMKMTKHDLQAHLPFSLPPVKADPDSVLEVLDNLLTNAINYSPNGSKILVEAEREEDQVKVSVSDGGIGIPEDKRELIFQKFYRIDTPLKQEVDGTGLGLSLCRTIIEAHGGRIWVESEERRGSTFYFTLPVWTGL